MFRHQPLGFTNHDLRPLIAELRGLTPDQVTVGQMAYDLRRLHLHGLITRIQHTQPLPGHRHRPEYRTVPIRHPRPPTARRTVPPHRTSRSTFRTADCAYRQAIETLNHTTGLAA